MNTLFESITDTLPIEEAQFMDSLITQAEVEWTLNSFSNNKAPGLDGIPSEVLRELTPIASRLTDLFNVWFLEGSIPKELTEGVVTLLHKKGDPALIGNYRPITLLNSLFKAFTRILASRLNHVLPLIISHSQSAIPGRFIGNNIRFMLDVLEYSRINNRPLYVLLTDLEKAFDRINHDYLFSTLQRYGFGDTFVNCCKSLYKNAESVINVNGSLSSTVFLRSGVRQGDPLSPLLFVIAIEPLISAIMNDTRIKGFTLDNNTTKILGYADDLAMFSTNSNDIAHIEFWLDLFEKASASKFNKDKCELITNSEKCQSLFFLKQRSDLDYSFRYLGLDVSFNSCSPWPAMLEKVRRTAVLFSKAHLTLRGKIAVANNHLIPLTTFVAQLVPIPEKTTKEVLTCIRDFIWNGKKSKVSLEELYKPIELGGLGLINLNCFYQSLQAKWVCRLLDPHPLPWKPLARWALSNVYADHGLDLSCIFCYGSTRDANRALPILGYFSQLILETQILSVSYK